MDANAVLSQMRAAGLVVDSLNACGKIVRVPVCEPRPDKGSAKSGWYVVHEFTLSSGGIGLAGSFGNYKLGEEASQKIDGSSNYNAADKAEYARKRAEAEKRAAEEAQRAANECGVRANKIWQNLPHDGPSAYLSKKQVAAFGLRFSRGSVVVPLFRSGGTDNGSAFSLSLVGLQFIDATGDKKFLTGTPKKSSFHWIGDVPAAGAVLDVLVVEGYATGASAHMATGLPVAVAFDAGNLMPVAKALRDVLPHARICIAGDNDTETDGNPGVTRARSAASAVKGCCVVPSFTEGNSNVAE